MGLGDKIAHQAQEAAGKIKEKVGAATDNQELQAEGVKDQIAGNVKQAADKVNDAVKDARERFKK